MMDTAFAMLLTLALGAVAGWFVGRKCIRQTPEVITKRVANLLTVKSLVTIALTVAFIVQTCRGELDKEMMTIYSMVMTFYFVSQSGKVAGEEGNSNG